MVVVFLQFAEALFHKPLREKKKKTVLISVSKLGFESKVFVYVIAQPFNK